MIISWELIIGTAITSIVIATIIIFISYKEVKLEIIINIIRLVEHKTKAIYREILGSNGIGG